MPSQNITQDFVNKVKFSENTQILYMDTSLTGFGLLVGKQKKSFIAQGTVHKRTVRHTIGSASIFKVGEAKEQARKLLVDMRSGINPKIEARKRASKATTLQEAYDKLIQQKGGKLKPRTVRDYNDHIKNGFKEWGKKPLTDITPDMVTTKFTELSQKSPYSANGAMKLLKQIYNFQSYEDPDLRNPVDIISKRKLWNRKTVRQTRLKDHQIRHWYKAVRALPNETFRDAVLLVFLTGLRKNEAFTLKWSNIDLKERTIHLPDTKNNKPHTIPVSSAVIDILEKRKCSLISSLENPNADINDYFVFPSVRGDGPITDAKSSIKIIVEQTGIKFMIHDLRRTFITKATEIGIPEVIIKRLVNHSSGGNVTHGYIVLNHQTLEDNAEKVTQAFLKLIQC